MSNLQNTNPTLEDDSFFAPYQQAWNDQNEALNHTTLIPQHQLASWLRHPKHQCRRSRRFFRWSVAAAACIALIFAVLFLFRSNQSYISQSPLFCSASTHLQHPTSATASAFAAYDTLLQQVLPLVRDTFRTIQQVALVQNLPPQCPLHLANLTPFCTSSLIPTLTATSPSPSLITDTIYLLRYLSDSIPILPQKLDTFTFLKMVY